MAIRMSEFIKEGEISILVNFPSKIKNVVNNKASGYVLDKKSKESILVLSYLKEKTKKSEMKIEQALELVKLKKELYQNQLKYLTKSELKKVFLAEVLLIGSEVIICENFFDDLIYCEKEYFKRFFRNLVYKKNKNVILIVNDMNFVCEYVKRFYLFTENGKYKLVEDFYDDSIYRYTKMPFTVELVKYLESMGHKIDHEITFNETLKAIYRGVS